MFIWVWYRFFKWGFIIFVVIVNINKRLILIKIILINYC